MMSKLRVLFQRTWLVLAIAGIIIVLDQWTKNLVRATIPDFTYTIPIPQLGEYFVFEHVHNYGAAFGILQNFGNFFILVAAVVAIAIFIYVLYLPPQQTFVRVLLGLQLGGALGNVIDRIQQGYVTDFVKMGIPGVYYWPNWNIADASIVCGTIGLGVYILLEDLRRQRRPENESAPVGGGAGHGAASGESGAATPQDLT
jgi:signal peptidase II